MMRSVILILILYTFTSDLIAQMDQGKYYANDRYVFKNYPEVLNERSPSLFINVPGGLANYLTEINFNRSSITQFNQLGSFGLFNNGINTSVKTEKYRFLATYNYRNFNSYRQHNNEYGTIVKLALQANTGNNSQIDIRGYYLAGQLKMPGSLLKKEFEDDPFMADQRSIDRDEKRTTASGRADINYSVTFGKSLNNEIRIITYGKVESFVRTTKEYKIINRYGLGFTTSYKNRSRFGIRENEFSIESELYTQPERTEYYENLGGEKSDNLEQITNENIRNARFGFSDNFEIVTKKLFVVLTGRYDNEHYTNSEETLPSRKDGKTFKAFTPVCSFNYKLTKWIKIYTSYGLSFVSPTVKELESPDPAFLFNQDLKAQTSKDFTIGIQGNLVKDSACSFNSLQFDIGFFNHNIDNEIVPFEVFGEEYYRNAARSDRLAFKVSSELKIFKNFAFLLAYNFSHFTYRSNQIQSFETENDSTENIIKVYRDYSGNIEPGFPVNYFLIALSYERIIVKKINIFARITYSGISGLWVDDANSDKTGSCQTFNGLAGCDLHLRHFNLLVSAGIDNIFNQLYVGYVTINSANKRFYNPGAPRNYYCSFDFIYTF